MAVITISREVGSLGTVIGNKAAELLGYRYVGKKTIEKVLQQYGFVQFDELYRSTPGFWAGLDDTNLLMISMLNQCIQALARHGDIVLVGRGGFAVLSDYADVLNVRVQAPLAVRVQHMMAREGAVDRQAVEEQVKANDRARTAFLQTFYGLQPDAAGAFDLVVDTGAISPEMAASWVVAATQALDQREGKAGSTTRQIEVDPILAKTVADVLERLDHPED